MYKYRLIRLVAGVKTVLYETDSAEEVAQAYRQAEAAGAFVRIEADGKILLIYQADEFCKKMKERAIKKELRVRRKA